MNDRKEVRANDAPELADRLDRGLGPADPDRHGRVVYPLSNREVWCSRIVGCAATAALLVMLVL